MRVFVGGGTGATGQAFVARARERGLAQVVHVRPGSAAKYGRQQAEGPEPAVFDLIDVETLDLAMAGCTALVSMIGTMKKRFDTGDTYAASDVGTTQLLVAAARRAGVEHVVLMSAYGAAKLPGPYYEAKRAAEAIVQESGMAWTITRPSALYGNGRGMALPIPGLGGLLDDVRPIPVDVVARAMVRIVEEGTHRGEVVSGKGLWALGG